MNKRAKEKYLEWKKIEKKLQVADILLLRRRRSFLSKQIRIATNSYWNHTAIVFRIPNEQNQTRNVLIIEALHGIEIHRLESYTKKLDIYDIGVKRVPGLNKELQKKIITFMLDNVDTPYDYTRLLGIFIRHYLWKSLLKYREHLINKDYYVCSSFTQRAFYRAMPENRKKDVLFRKDVISDLDLEDIAPGDIAKSTNCKWIYNPHN